MFTFIEVGKRLITAKALVAHGEWSEWLKNNFSLSQETARKFMRCSEQFANSTTSWNLSLSQMVELLTLPAPEDFIKLKESEGNPVENLTIKQLREEIAGYKAAIEQKDKTIEQKDKTYQQSLFDLCEKNVHFRISLHESAIFFQVQK